MVMIAKCLAGVGGYPFGACRQQAIRSLGVGQCLPGVRGVGGFGQAQPDD
jgi:hypothetical protein